MKYLNKPTIGIFIGSLIILSFCLDMYSVLEGFYRYSQLTPKEKRSRRYQFIELWVFLGICLIAITITGLLIAGIIKKNHKLIKPWMYCTVLGIICQCLVIVSGYFFLYLHLGIMLAISLCVFLFMFLLYDDIRKDNEAEQNNISPNSAQQQMLHNSSGQVNYV